MSAIALRRPPPRAFAQLVHVALLVEPALSVALDYGARSVHDEGAAEVLRRLGRMAGEWAPSCDPESAAWPAALTARAMLALLGRMAERGHGVESKALLTAFIRLHDAHWDRLVAFYAPGTPERWTRRWPLGS